MRETSEVRQAILDAAIEEFREFGYHGANMDRIAERAPASKRTVYKYFSTKERLFEEVVDWFKREISSLHEIRYDPEQGLEEQLLKFIRARAAVVEEPAWRGLMKVALSVHLHEPGLAEAVSARSDHGEDALIRWLEEASADGKVSLADATLAAKVFWAMVGGGLFWPQILRGLLDPSESEPLQRELIQTFLARYGTGGSARHLGSTSI